MMRTSQTKPRIQEEKLNLKKSRPRSLQLQAAVLPRWPWYYRATELPGPTTVIITALVSGFTVAVTVVAAVLPRPRYYHANHGTTVLPARKNRVAALVPPFRPPSLYKQNPL